MRRVVCAVLLSTPGLAWADPESLRVPSTPATFETTSPVPRPQSEPGGISALRSAPPERAPRRWGLFGGGVALFGLAYAADAGATYGLGRSSASTALIPFAGPLIQLSQPYTVVTAPTTGSSSIDSQTSSAADSVNRTVQIVAQVGLVLDFALQVTGAALAIAGPLTRRRMNRVFASAPGGLAVKF